MNKAEAAQLLAIIKVAYPMAYRDVDKETTLATMNMWAMSFPDVPYPIMEQAFNHFRMVSKFPPTVAEMVEELRKIHYQATERALVCQGLGEHDMAQRYWAVMDCTARYKNDDHLGGLNIDALPRIGGTEYAQLPGTPGD